MNHKDIQIVEKIINSPANIISQESVDEWEAHLIAEKEDRKKTLKKIIDSTPDILKILGWTPELLRLWHEYGPK